MRAEEKKTPSYRGHVVGVRPVFLCLSTSVFLCFKSLDRNAFLLGPLRDPSKAGVPQSGPIQNQLSRNVIGRKLT